MATLFSKASKCKNWKESIDLCDKELADLEKSYPVEAKVFENHPDHETYARKRETICKTRFELMEAQEKEEKELEVKKAAEAGYGVREFKVINTTEKHLKTLSKSIDIAKKKVDKVLAGKVGDYIEDLKKAYEEVWDILISLDNPTEKDLSKIGKLVSKNPKWSVYASLLNYDFYFTREERKELFNKGVNFETASENYCNTLLKRLEARNKDKRETEKENSKNAKARAYKSLRDLFYKVDVKGVSALQTFLDNWKKDYIEYYTDEKNKKNAEDTLTESLRVLNTYRKEHEALKNGWRSWGDSEYRRLEDEYDEAAVTNTLFQRNIEDIRKDSEELAEALEINFIKSISKYCKNIKDVDLWIGQGGNINGTVYEEDGKNWSVETVRAGGYNIQRLHLRTLVHEIK